MLKLMEVSKNRFLVFAFEYKHVLLSADERNCEKEATEYLK